MSENARGLIGGVIGGLTTGLLLTRLGAIKVKHRVDHRKITITSSDRTVLYSSTSKANKIIQFYIDVSKLDPDNIVVIRESISAHNNTIVIEETYTINDIKTIMSDIHFASAYEISIQITNLPENESKDVEITIYEMIIEV